MSSDESVLAQSLLEMKKLPTIKNLQDKYLIKPQKVPDITQRQHDINDYDQLLKGKWRKNKNSKAEQQ